MLLYPSVFVFVAQFRPSRKVGVREVLQGYERYCRSPIGIVRCDGLREIITAAADAGAAAGAAAKEVCPGLRRASASICKVRGIYIPTSSASTPLSCWALDC